MKLNSLHKFLSVTILISVIFISLTSCYVDKSITSTVPGNPSGNIPSLIAPTEEFSSTQEPSVNITQESSISAENYVWKSLGPDGGIVYSLAINRNNPTILYAAAGGGVFKTTDGGNQWFPVNSGLTSLNISRLVIDPSTPEIIYAVSPRSGIFKSTDGGLNWILVGEGYNSFDIDTLAIDPITTTTLYVGLIGTRGGVFKSVDGGMTWAKTRLINTEVSIIEPDSMSPGTIYAVADGGLVKSTDGGQNWDQASSGLPEPPYNYVECLAVDPTRPGTLYVGTEVSGIYKSTNAGRAWQRADNGLAKNNSCSELVIDPSGQTIYAKTRFDGFVKSVDGGQNWVKDAINRSLMSRLVFDPQSATTVYGTGESGVVKSIDGGNTWENINSGITSANIYSMSIDPNAPGTMYASVGTKDYAGGLYKTTDGGKNWNKMTIDIYSINLSSFAMAPTSPTSLIMIANTDIYKSMDGGVNWVRIDSGFSRSVDKLIIDPKTPTTIFAVGYGGYRSIDGGESWRAIFNGLPDIEVDSLVINPIEPSIIYALTHDGIYISVNAGQSWVKPINSFSTGFNTLVIDQEEPTVLYATIYSDKYKSLDSGETWNEYGVRESDSAITAMVINPNTPDTFYMGTESDGVFISTDRGATWNQIINGLYNPHVTCFMFDPNNSTLYAGTAGGGVFVLHQK
jgi:photosystem II stability/assembly factor-like uncharacterized protein